MQYMYAMLCSGASDELYLEKLRSALDEVHQLCPQPDLVFYNAGEALWYKLLIESNHHYADKAFMYSLVC